ncbi:hypothetical protein DSO57_1003246 [Entomophthora muscae]|uniref:Uncharacterized protein n=1 Tax=Entomophthora muscae TaxID=34485 RepID=A0ACC2TX40_9FUNG|nr:hypothetical protein DSO57_1003246 [Entomophthora muscae]
MKIHASEVNDFPNNGYTLDEAVKWSIKKVSLRTAPPPKQATRDSKLSYSDRAKKGMETELNKFGFIPFEDFLREHTAQGNPFKTIPCSPLNNVMRIHVDSLSKGSIKQCKDAIYKALDDQYPEHKLDSQWSVTEGYLDIGFESSTIRDTSLTMEIYHNGNPLKIESTRYNKLRAKWVTFLNLPTNKDYKWVREALVMGLSYYGNIHKVIVEGANKAKCMRPKSRGISLPRFIRLPGCADTNQNRNDLYADSVSKWDTLHLDVHIERDPTQERLIKMKRMEPFLDLNLSGGSPPKVTDFLDMQAIQQTMVNRHAEDRARADALTNGSKTEDHKDPSTPVTVHIDVEPPAAERTIHPDLEDWKKANKHTPNPKSQKKKHKPTQATPAKETPE